jgi:hypothetical protein
MGIGDGRSTYTDSTLMRLTKAELIDIIRVFEKNCKIYLNDLNHAYTMLKELTEIIEFKEG